MRALDGHFESNISADTATFNLDGGLYGVDCVGTSFGTVKLQKQANDASTYLSVSTATDFAASGYTTVYLPPGLYKIAVTTTTAVYVGIKRIPSE